MPGIYDIFFLFQHIFIKQPLPRGDYSAWLAAENAREQPQHRVRIINPEAEFDHIPALLRDIQAHALPEDPSGLARFAQRNSGSYFLA